MISAVIISIRPIQYLQTFLKLQSLTMHTETTTSLFTNFLTSYRTVLISILALLPLLGGTWILGLLFLFDSDSEPLAWIFTILNSLQV